MTATRASTPATGSTPSTDRPTTTLPTPTPAAPWLDAINELTKGWPEVEKPSAKLHSCPPIEEKYEILSSAEEAKLREVAAAVRKKEQTEEAASGFKTTGLAAVSNEELHEMFKKEWDKYAEGFQDESKQSYSAKELQAIEKLKKETRVMPNGRTRAPILWDGERPKLKNNRHMVLQRLKSLHKSKLLGTPERMEAYNRCFLEWEALGIIEECEPGTGEEQNYYYAAHFPVFKDSPTTPCRPVFDLKSRYNNTKSINECILSGPNLAQDLRVILTKVRQKKFMLIADVVKMFLQLEMEPEDCDMHRFLWSKDPNAEPREYRFLRHTFGNAGSPCVAQFTVKEKAEELKDLHPLAAEIILKNLLLDDNSGSFDTEEQTIAALEGLRAIYDTRCMKLAKIGSNSKRLMAQVPEKERLPVREFVREEADDLRPQTTMLGVILSLKNDNFHLAKEDDPAQFEPPVTKRGKGSRGKPQAKTATGSGSASASGSSKPNTGGTVSWTKRQIASFIPRRFDPLNLCAPALVQGRVFFQRLWVLGIDWDDKVPQELIDEHWQPWVDSLKCLHEVAVPRFLGSFENTSGLKKQELLVFSDASGDAHAYSSYIRSTYNDGEVHTGLLAANYHVSPMKATSIPRLELMGLDLALEVFKLYNTPVYNIRPEDVHFFVDSITVYRWFVRESRSLKIFVSNRISRAQRKILKPNLHYVPTGENPSDLPTRGVVPALLKDNDLWFKGPEFIRQKGELTFPKLPQLTKEEEEKVATDVQKEMLSIDAIFANATPEGRFILEETVDGVIEAVHDINAKTANTWPELLEQYLTKRDENREAAGQVKLTGGHMASCGATS